jgi:hypothetical protein
VSSIFTMTVGVLGTGPTPVNGLTAAGGGGVALALVTGVLVVGAGVVGVDSGFEPPLQAASPAVASAAQASPITRFDIVMRCP